MKEADFEDGFGDGDVDVDVDASASTWDINRPETWPLLPRVLLLCAIYVVAVALVWQFWGSGVQAELEHARGQQVQLQDMQRAKLALVQGMGDLRRRHHETTQQSAQLAVQVPASAELDALAVELHRAAHRRGVRLELFRPGAAALQNAHAELPVMLKVAGRFHDLGRWMSDLAQLPRIVTLHDVSLLPGPAAGVLMLEATLKVYRALNAAEREAARSGRSRTPVASTGAGSAAAPGAGTAAYTGAAYVDPYSRLKLRQPAPEPRRTTVTRASGQQTGGGVLQDHALSDLRMVGSLRRQGRVAALIEAGKRVHLVEPGAQIGRSRALVMSISETQMVVRETVRTESGAPRTRDLVLRLREK